jgi:hypothetical protein
VATILPTRKLEVSREYIMSEIKGDQELEVGERLVIHSKVVVENSDLVLFQAHWNALEWTSAGHIWWQRPFLP